MIRPLTLACCALLLFSSACTTRSGCSDCGSPASVGFNQTHDLVLGPGGKGEVSGSATYAHEPLTWTLDPPDLVTVQDPKDSPFHGGWSWGRSWRAEIVAGSTLGNGILTLHASTEQGPRSGSLKIRIVSGIQVLPPPQVNLVPPGGVFHPSMVVGWGTAGGNTGVPQGLLWDIVEPFPGGSLTRLDLVGVPYYAEVKAPTIPGTYHLHATALADPSASGLFEFKVQ
jgi:hypothetical protein